MNPPISDIILDDMAGVPSQAKNENSYLNGRTPPDTQYSTAHLLTVLQC